LEAGLDGVLERLAHEHQPHAPVPPLWIVAGLVVDERVPVEDAVYRGDGPASHLHRVEAQLAPLGQQLRGVAVEGLDALALDALGASILGPPRLVEPEEVRHGPRQRAGLLRALDAV